MEIKNLKIWPRKKSDRGGYACMPLKRNVPEGKKGWKLTTCPECGALCWKTPLFESIMQNVLGGHNVQPYTLGKLARELGVDITEIIQDIEGGNTDGENEG